jgi:hypothetical protein
MLHDVGGRLRERKCDVGALRACNAVAGEHRVESRRISLIALGSGGGAGNSRS